MDEIKAGITAFIKFSNEHPKHRAKLCEEFIDEVVLFGANYLIPKANQKNNVVFIPPDAAPVVMIPTCVPLQAGADMVYDGLERYLSKCGEFTDPLEDIVTEDEMNAVLDSAQSKFKILDIIAPVKPLRVVSLNNSHFLHNCECGISADPASRESVIFVYHPRDVSVCDRVFIFAHEIGHALHMALTGNMEAIPDRFDSFNEALNIKWKTTKEKQEAFADVTAFAILGTGELRKHLPHSFSDSMLDAFHRYISYVTENHVKLSI